MLRIRTVGLALLVFWVVSGSAWISLAGQGFEQGPPAVILISLDGTRPEDVTPETMPVLADFSRSGVVADGLQSVFPSNTFPAHVSLATGVAPERHGLVNNAFRDPNLEMGIFHRSAPDIPRWIEVEPIWSLLESAGLPTASFHWVGSEGAWPESDRGPRSWKKFDSRTSEAVKVDQILAWMNRPPSERPRLITVWFHGADGPGHRDGPGADSVKSSLRRQDREIGRLIENLQKRGQLSEITILIVSDHGMVSAERFVDLKALLEDPPPREGPSVSAEVYGVGGFASVVLRDRPSSQVALVGEVVKRVRRAGLEAYPRTQAPRNWRVGHSRFGDVVVRAPIGTAIVREGLRIKGFHGYSPTNHEMDAVFYAIGRGVEPGRRLSRVRSVDVAPTILNLLAQPIPSWMEGRSLSLTGDPASN
ncbi:MAG: alkaline phosphatase family protein [Myxococcota bacterium]|nr:alkaline phosphatase family protein [Myxococcota bacterium]